MSSDESYIERGIQHGVFSLLKAALPDIKFRRGVEFTNTGAGILVFIDLGVVLTGCKDDGKRDSGFYIIRSHKGDDLEKALAVLKELSPAVSFEGTSGNFSVIIPETFQSVTTLARATAQLGKPSVASAKPPIASAFEWLPVPPRMSDWGWASLAGPTPR